MALLAVNGCGAPLRPAQIQVPPAFQAHGDAVPDTALDAWWLLFDDMQLTTMIEQALIASPDARSAMAVLEESRAVRSQALSAYDPQGGLSASTTYQKSTVSVSGSGAIVAPGGGTTTMSTGFSPSWELGLFGRKSALRSSSDADLDAARFTYEASRQSLATSIASNLFEGRGLALQLAEAVESERVVRELATLGTRRVETGIGAPADAALLDADLASAIANRQSLTARLSVAKRTLLLLLGRGTDPVETLVIDARLGNPPLVPSTTPGTLLARRPDIRQAEAQVRSAAGALRLDQLALLPSFTLTPSAGQTKVTGPGAYSAGIWSIGANLLLPILDRPRLLAEIRAERSRGEQAIIAYEKTVQTAYGEAENTLTTYMADRDRLTQLAMAEERSRQAFEAQRSGYRAGIIDLTSLLTAERTWRSARLALSQLRATALSDAVNVYRALGGGWSPDAAASPQPRSSQVAP